MKAFFLSAMLSLACAACATPPAGSPATGQAQAADQVAIPGGWTGGRERARAYNTSNGG